MDPNPANKDVALRGLGLFVAFSLIGLVLYWRVLDAPLFSDDNLYTIGNPWVTGFSLATFAEMLQPTSGASMSVLNYAPVHLVLHSITWAAFGSSTPGHHIVNVLMHAFASLLLVGVLIRSGVAQRLAVFGGLAFLIHPANVEAVAWISQLKTTAACVLALAALLWIERRPALATVSFALAIATKALAAFALPVAVVWWWTRGAESGVDPRTRNWLAVWGAIFVAIAIAQFVALLNASLGLEPPHSAIDVTLRSSVALAMRYLAMATATVGLSAFHEPPPVASWLDPWWLGGLAALAVLGARAFITLRERREEAGFWVWATVSFVPISQLFPFQFAIGDRYLYLILPGLIGAACLAGSEFWTRLAKDQRNRTRAALVCGVLIVALFGARTIERVGVWTNPLRLMAESIENYPDGMNAAIANAGRAAVSGNPDAAMEILISAQQRGVLDVSLMTHNPNFSKLRGRADYRAIVDDWAGKWVEKLRSYERPSQYQLLSMGMAHEVRRERSQARHAYQLGLAEGGVYDARLRENLRALGY